MDFKVKYNTYVTFWKAKQLRDEKTIISHRLQVTQFGESTKGIKIWEDHMGN